jgi:competence protein ComEA
MLERFKYLILLLLAGVTIAGVAVLLWRQPEPTSIKIIPPQPTAIPSVTPLPSLTPTPGPYTVYITGAVATPEIVITLDYGSRVIDALYAAGGPLNNANLERVNLAQILEDGDHIQVPTRESDDPAPTAVIQQVTATPGMYVVYVTGEVQQPQAVVTLAAGSRVQDAIEAAGGTTENADLDQVNLTQILNDGDLVYVPPIIGDAIQTPTPNHAPIVHINTATLAELDTLPGVGEDLAQTIIDYRAEHGPFTSFADLDNVPGIGPSKLEDWQTLIVFD